MDAMSSTNVTEISFDTNILFYGFDRRDVTKHRIANVVLDRCFAPDNPIAMQVLAEFYRSAARKLVRPEAAKAIVEDYLQGMRVISAETSDLRSAMQLHQAGELQFFDALVLVTLEPVMNFVFASPLESVNDVDSLALQETARPQVVRGFSPKTCNTAGRTWG